MGHRVTSPLLLGVRDGNSGLGNNADEIKTASLLFNNITIKTLPRPNNRMYRSNTSKKTILV